jgi:hypothetical protein
MDFKTCKFEFCRGFVAQALVDAEKVPHRVILSEAKNLSSV